MPLYVYRCARCSREHEELQRRHDDPAPVLDEPCGEHAQHDLERVITPVTHKFRGDNSSDGIGGWKRQGKNGELVVRQVSGQNSTKYGDGSV